MKVTVIIPCYNVQDYVEECLNSVLVQTYKNIEVICVDNNSTDETLTRLFELQKKHPQIIVLEEKQKGAPYARNKGLEIATGEWIQFLDADDLLEPSKIEHQINLITDNPDIPFIAAASFKQNLKEQKKLSLPETDVWKGLFSTNLGITSANLFNTQKVREIGGWNTSLKSSQEYDLMFRLLKQFGNPLIDNEPLTVIRERASGQISQTNLVGKWEQYVELRIAILEYLKSEKPQTYTVNKDWFFQTFFVMIRILYKYNRTKALQVFKKYFDKKFQPLPSEANSKRYCILYRIFGFQTVEEFRSIGILDNSSPNNNS